MIIGVVTAEAPASAPRDDASAQRSSIMTILTEAGRSFEPSARAMAGRHPRTTHVDHLTTVGQIGRFALLVLLMGGVLAGIIALKTLAFVWHLHA